jgi:hypothetical protein
MWGTVRDKHLLSSLERRFTLLSEFAKGHNLTILEGPQLKKIPSGREAEGLISRNEIVFDESLVGKSKLNMNVLKGWEHVFSFPDESLVPIERDNAYIRRRGGVSPLKVCRPPHIIVDAARTFSVFSDEYIVVPARQIGIAGDSSELLKVLSLYLSSDFVFYHQFLTSETSFGVERDLTNKKDLLSLPVPLNGISSNDLSEWVKLHKDLVAACSSNQKQTPGPLFKKSGVRDVIKPLLNELNKAVYDLLGIAKREQSLINDFLQTRMKLNEGAIAEEAMKHASKPEMMAYALTMKNELNSFLDQEDKHKVKIYYGSNIAIVEILHLKNSGAGQPEIIEVDTQTQAEFTKLAGKLTREQGQWIYFKRGLRIPEGRTTYIFKPRQRLYWLQSQALVDADEFIEAKLTPSQ